MQMRESGKPPNFLIGGMNLTANRMNVEELLHPHGSLLMRSLLQGPVRFTRNLFLRHVFTMHGLHVCPCIGSAYIQPHHVMEIGGGCGGDCPIWCNDSKVHIVDVVEPDTVCIQEYQRRLTTSFAGKARTRVALCDVALLQSRNVVSVKHKEFRFHPCPVFDLTPDVCQRGVDLVLLYFSISQIVSCDSDTFALLGGLFLSRNVSHATFWNP